VTPQELKKALVAAGFEIYRTLGEDVVLADRARENLILDSGVRVRPSASSPTALQIRAIMGIRKAAYPSDDEAALYERIRVLAAPLVSEGFTEVSTGVAPVIDPADATRTLDTFYEVVFAKDEASLEAAADALRLTLKVAKTAESRH